SMVISPPSPMVQDVLQKLNLIGADFIWIFAVYQEQMRINKQLKDEVTKISASHKMLHQIYDLQNRRSRRLSLCCTTDMIRICASLPLPHRINHL
ncbi:uncharacterized protein PV09_09852, partial [Verruconis gallopava]